MLVFSYVCNFCGNQVEIPFDVPEDRWRSDNKPIAPSKSLGIAIDLRCTEIKSYETVRNKNSKGKERELTFCSKDCIVEFIKKNIDDDGKHRL